jgi:peptide chain release factor 2
MSDGIVSAIQKLKVEIEDAYTRLDIEVLKKDLQRLEEDSQAADFWNNSSQAQASLKQIAVLRLRIEPWQDLLKNIHDLEDLSKLNDSTLSDEITEQLKALEELFNNKKRELAFSGPYDDHSALLTIHSGAGGTDAQDWAQMLLRMYSRWAEAEGAKLQLIEQSSGDEAGIKSATLEIDIPYAYGKLKGEHGVHRLVRLSPFNADNLRQTSFAKVDVIPKIDKPDELEIDDKDLRVDVFRAGGHGGQSVNTTDSAVRITHIPTNLTVSIQNERSQIQNKETAMTILRSRLAQLQLEQHQETLSDLKGPNQSAEWGNQIRSYVLHPYKQVKDLRTRFETSDPQGVLDGNINSFIESYLDHNLEAGD